MKSYISPRVKLSKSENEKGLFAIKKISKGELIVDFSNAPGLFLSLKDYNKLYKKGFDYDIQIDDDLFFAATNKKELEDADFINHSCDPNCGIKDNMKIFAMRDINPGEEITFDYAMSESFNYKMKCKCGNSNCRKIITGNDWKKKELQKKYNGFFSDYLKRNIKK